MSDLISRKEAKDAIYESFTPYQSAWVEKIRQVWNAIDSVPTVEAVPVVHGEWVKNKQNPEVMKKVHEMGIGKGMGVNSIYWTCSECGSWGTPTSNFCSNCGADMRKKV